MLGEVVTNVLRSASVTDYISQVLVSRDWHAQGLPVLSTIACRIVPVLPDNYARREQRIIDLCQRDHRFMEMEDFRRAVRVQLWITNMRRRDFSVLVLDLIGMDVVVEGLLRTPWTIDGIRKDVLPTSLSSSRMQEVLLDPIDDDIAIKGDCVEFLSYLWRQGLYDKCCMGSIIRILLVVSEISSSGELRRLMDLMRHGRTSHFHRQLDHAGPRGLAFLLEFETR